MSAEVVTLIVLFFASDGSGVLQAAWSPDKTFDTVGECEAAGAEYLTKPVAPSYVEMKRKTICVDSNGAQ